MRHLREVLKQVEESRAANGHINVADLVLLKAVFAFNGYGDFRLDVS